MAGALALSLGGSYAGLMVACFIISIGMGFTLVAAPAYNVEIAPPSTRGVLSSLLNGQMKKVWLKQNLGPARKQGGAMTHDAAAEATTTKLLAVLEKPRRNMYAFACVTLASMTTIVTGYNLALMSGAELFIREDLGLTDTQVELLAGSMNVFMLASILFSGWTADLLGRRVTLVVANAFLTAGALAMSLGGGYAALMAARFVTSIGMGLTLVVAPVYNAEISPPSTRGVLSSLLDIFINVGILLGYTSNYALAGLPAHLAWRIMYAIGVLPPVLLAVGVLAMPESPRWLAMRGRHAEARAVLWRTSDTAEEADVRLEDIKRAFDAPQAAGSVWQELIVRPSATEASGIDAVVLYSPLVFNKAGMSATSSILGATVAVGVVKTCFIFVAMLLVDRTRGRSLEDMEALFAK
ncbi:Putative polyol transporter 1 [Triticum urartu]|uniref:Putative polyol transporter 1 n=1 Tax=Triticum urartu TaxID=4572 RepID=M8AFJ9_TRIUA|nr:Putative polyol transporter 1 [Triticum urartu]